MHQNYALLKKYPVVETILEQGSSSVNEDALCATQDIFGVFDGSTSLDGNTFDGKTGGQLAAEISALGFGNYSGSLVQKARKVNQKIADEMKKAELTSSDRLKFASTSAALIKIHPHNIEWGQIGDCRIVLVYQDNTYKLLHDPVDHDKESLEMMASLGGLDSCGSKKFKKQVARVRNKMNIDYGVLNGEAGAMNFFTTGLESRAKIKTAIIFSDGLLIPGENGIDEMVQIYLAGGLTKIKDTVRKRQKEDHNALSWPRFKKHDDISGIAIRFSA
ncbi:MAG: protein phosphatase 2C domain-containing protein [Desulfotalea sp.]